MKPFKDPKDEFRFEIIGIPDVNQDSKPISTNKRKIIWIKRHAYYMINDKVQQGSIGASGH